MPRVFLHLAAGTGRYRDWPAKTIRLVRYGCTNRPFYHIVVIELKKGQRTPPIEQVGSYDPCVNISNEKLVSFNFDRIQYWLGKGNTTISAPVENLLGLAGFLPINPRTYMNAWRNRRKADEAAATPADDTASDAEGKSAAAGAS